MVWDINKLLETSAAPADEFLISVTYIKKEKKGMENSVWMIPALRLLRFLFKDLCQLSEWE